MNRKFFTLTDIAHSISNALKEKTEIEFWATAEIVKLNYYKHSGHCYPQLVEKKNNKVVAEMRSLIWKMDYFKINNHFRKITGEPLHEGITIFFKTKLKYDALYGLSLQILEIDPVYSLGAMEHDRLVCIERLQTDGVFELNKNLASPPLIKSLAVISVETSKGYQDFQNIVQKYGRQSLHLDYTLYPSLLQGERSPKSILDNLQTIENNRQYYDAVAIIRGGGGDVGLASFNNYELSRRIATFPIPVLSGIGHASNETVTEMVSHRHFITPTDLAQYVMDGFIYFQNSLETQSHRLIHAVKYLLSQQSSRLASAKKSLKQNTFFYLSQENRSLHHHDTELQKSANHFIATQRSEIQRLDKSLIIQSQKYLSHLSQRISVLDKTIEMLSPERILERGFTMTSQHGMILQSIDQIDPTALITTQFHDGSISSLPTTK